MAPQSRRTLFLISYYYLYLPLAIFLCFWVVPYIGIPVAVVLGLLPLKLGSDINGSTPAIPGKKLAIAIIILLLWVILSGVGGYVWQNRYDHMFRNAVFLDLVNREWPVCNGADILTYYIGFWLPPSLIAKIFGSVEAGWFMQLVYAFIGVYLAFRLTIGKAGSFRLTYLLPFILFSGLDVVAFPLAGATLPRNLHIELWSELAAWESNTTLLYWVYNQAVPAWVATMFLLNFKDSRGVPAVTLSLLCISAPFAVVGLFPLAVYYVGADAFRARNFVSGLSRCLSPFNIIAVIAALPVIIYLSFNSTDGIHISFWGLSAQRWIYELILLLAAELLIFTPFIYRQVRRSPDFYILFFTCVAGLIFVMGKTGDFNSRIELPLNYFMTLQIIIFLSRWKEIARRVKVAFISVSILCIITPALEIARPLIATYRWPVEEYRSYAGDSIFELPYDESDYSDLKSNFIGQSVLSNESTDWRLKLFNYPEK